MTFALQEAKLWEHISGTVMRPPELKPHKNDDEDRQERIWLRSGEIRDIDQDVQKATAKISKMCSEYCSERVPLATQVNQMKTERTLGMA